MLERGALSEALGEVLVGLPAEAKVIGSQADDVVPLEELAMRTLHRLYHHHPSGENTLVPSLEVGVRPLTTSVHTHSLCCLFRTQLAAPRQSPKEPAGPAEVPFRSLSPVQPSHVHHHLP